MVLRPPNKTRWGKLQQEKNQNPTFSFTLIDRIRYSTRNKSLNPEFQVLWFSLSPLSFPPSSSLFLYFPLSFLSLILSEQKDDVFYIKRKPRKKTALPDWSAPPPHRRPTNSMKLLLTTSSFPRVGPRIYPDSFQHHLVLLYDDTIHFPSFHFYLCYSYPKFFLFSLPYQCCILISAQSTKGPIMWNHKQSPLSTSHPTPPQSFNYTHFGHRLHSELQPFIYIFIFPTSTPQVLGRGRVEVHYLFQSVVYMA